MASTARSASQLPRWALAAGPVLVIALLAAGFLLTDPIGSLRGVAPLESVAIERTVLEEDRIILTVRNDARDPVTIAQVLVNEAYNEFTISDAQLSRLETAKIEIPYPWDEGLPLEIVLLTSTGVTIAHEIEAASLTPAPDLSTFTIYALLGVYIGVIPVAIGLLFFPSLRKASRRWLGFFLAFTVGLLVFLLIDTIEEGIELADETAAALNGLSLFAIGALAAVAALSYLSSAVERRGRARAGLALAYLIAAGIGLHNLGEGLAVGAALAAGEIALGTFLVLGFALHNTTEGLAIVAPLGSEDRRPSLWHFAALGALAGVPTIAGAVAGGFAFAPAWAALAFGVAAGAIAQVVWQIATSLPESSGVRSGAGLLGFVTGLVFMYATGLLT